MYILSQLSRADNRVYSGKMVTNKFSIGFAVASVYLHRKINAMLMCTL